MKQENPKCPTCGEKTYKKKTYVGNQGTYYICSMRCLHTFGGEETDAKKALIEAAASADVTEMDEILGKV